MKKLVLVVVALCLVAGFAFAAEQATGAAVVQATDVAAVTAPMVVKGTIVDNLCAGANSVNIAEFVKTHAKSCAVKPDCAASGYSIYTDGKIMKFDAVSSAKVSEFLKKDDSKLEVVAEVERAGDELKLVSIKNQ